MDILTIDLETLYTQDYSLSNLTTEEYIRDLRFETIMASIKWNDAAGFWVLPDRLTPFLRDEVDWNTTAVLCHHAHFDGLILSHHYGVRPAFWLDTLSMARVIDGPKAGHSLFDLCRRHGLADKGDYVVKAKGKHLADFSRDELKAYGAYCVNDGERTYQLAQKFLPQMPRAELRLIDLTIRMFTEPVFEGDQKLLADAVASEQARKADLLARVGAEGKEFFNSNEKFAALLRSIDCEPPMKVSPSSGEPIYAFAKTDSGMQALLESEREDVRFLAEARIAAKSTIIETRAKRFHDCATRGPMPVYLKYAGAHTWRWSGGDGMNWQNMSRENAHRPEMSVLKRAVLAPEGHSVVAADSAQIEARVLAWLAGQSDLVGAFAAGRDVYSEFAGEVIYLRPVDRKRVKEDFIPGQLGKVSVLGLGFGMGWYKFAMELLKGMLGAPPMQFKESDLQTLGVDPTRFLNSPKTVQRVHDMPSRLDVSDRLIHCIVANEIVNRYRARSEAIVRFWSLMDDFIRAMIDGRRAVAGPGDVLQTEGQAILLPDGMRLNYRDIRRSELKSRWPGDTGASDCDYWDGRERVKIYGGKLTENVVQALARSIVAHQMLEVADAGIKVATMGHDEIVTVVPQEDAKAALDYMLAVMSKAPAWAPGLPLAAEGGMGRSYGRLE